jgi:hypothetical protein
VRVVPDVPTGQHYDRSGRGPQLVRESHRVGPEGQQIVVRSNELVLVELAAHFDRDKDIPNPAFAPEAHPLDPAIPIVEVANDADPPCVRRPDREARAAYAISSRRCAPERLPQPQVVALADALSIEIAQHLPEAVGILEFKRRDKVVLAKPVRKRLPRGGSSRRKTLAGCTRRKTPTRVPVRASINSSDTAFGETLARSDHIQVCDASPGTQRDRRRRFLQALRSEPYPVSAVTNISTFQRVARSRRRGHAAS